MATTVHRGPYSSIASTASPGLSFLRDFLPALDSLDPSTHPVVPFLHPEASISVGSNPPNTGKQAVPLLEVRRKHLSSFHHDMHIAWDIVPEGQDPAQRRTVMFEATSATVFRNDPDQFAVRVKEFHIIELQKRPKEKEGEVPWQVVEMRTYLDARPVQDRAARLHMASTYGEAKTTS